MRSIRCDHRNELNFLCDNYISTDQANVSLHDTARGQGWTFDLAGTTGIDLCPAHSEADPIPKKGGKTR